MKLRKKYQPIIDKLQDRIDVVSHRWVTEQNTKDLWEYKQLVMEMEEIKEAIIASEKVNK